MRLLRLVGPGDDSTFVILETADGAEQFSLPLDETLRALVRDQRPAPAAASSRGRTPAEPRSTPAPREIQTRVRAGESPESIAEQAGIGLDRVMTFAYPVLQERVRVTSEARSRGRARRGGDGPLVPFGELLDARLSRHGVDPDTVVWDAFRREDGGWTLTAALTHAEHDLLAKFSFALSNRTLSALDDLAADLLSDGAVLAFAPPPPPPPPAPPVVEAEPAPAEPEQPGELAAPIRLAAVPDDDPDASRPAPPAPRRLRRQRAHTRGVPVGVEDELFDQESLPEIFQDPPLPLDFGPDAAAEEPTAEPAAEDEQADQPKRGRRTGEKPRMPSWDDILLGVRHKSD